MDKPDRAEGMTAKRLNIFEAKRKLYACILRLETNEFTKDDQRMARTLLKDSEVQSMFYLALKTDAGGKRE